MAGVEDGVAGGERELGMERAGRTRGRRWSGGPAIPIYRPGRREPGAAHPCADVGRPM
jgi:hypothetical protein